jgi:protein SCO1/2
VNSGNQFRFALLLIAVMSACSNPTSKLPKYDQVPAFAMVDSDGHPFQSRELSGKVWIADFIYTNCPAECPMMSARMHSLEKQLPAGDDIRLVSISVDPDRDTPSALKEFAGHYGAPTPRWLFLTGSAATVHQIAYKTFHVGDVIGKMQHSTKFVLVDKHGIIRGYYSSFDEEGLKTLLKDALALRKDRS